MRILGIDPGTTRIGFGIIEKSGNKLSPVRYGLISRDLSDGYNQLKHINSEIIKMVSEYKPDLAAIEKLFIFKNQKTVMAVSEMRGVILSALAQAGMEIHEFTPLQVKQAVSSYGRADKDQVQQMVRLILNIKEPIKPDDAADGLAIAICCANTIIG